MGLRLLVTSLLFVASSPRFVGAVHEEWPSGGFDEESVSGSFVEESVSGGFDEWHASETLRGPSTIPAIDESDDRPERVLPNFGQLGRYVHLLPQIGLDNEHEKTALFHLLGQHEGIKDTVTKIVMFLKMPGGRLRLESLHSDVATPQAIHDRLGDFQLQLYPAEWIPEEGEYYKVVDTYGELDLTFHGGTTLKVKETITKQVTGKDVTIPAGAILHSLGSWSRIPGTRMPGFWFTDYYVSSMRTTLEREKGKGTSRTFEFARGPDLAVHTEEEITRALSAELGKPCCKAFYLVGFGELVVDAEGGEPTAIGIRLVQNTPEAKANTMVFGGELAKRKIKGNIMDALRKPNRAAQTKP